LAAVFSFLFLSVLFDLSFCLLPPAPGAEYSCSFPQIYFNVEDFEDAFSNVIINAEEHFCVELAVAIDPKDKSEGVRLLSVLGSLVGPGVTFSSF